MGGTSGVARESGSGRDLRVVVLEMMATAEISAPEEKEGWKMRLKVTRPRLGDSTESRKYSWQAAEGEKTGTSGGICDGKGLCWIGCTAVRSPPGVRVDARRRRRRLGRVGNAGVPARIPRRRPLQVILSGRDRECGPFGGPYPEGGKAVKDRQ